MKRPVVFLDRDGTVNVDKDYLYRTGDFEFETLVPETLKYIYDKGYPLIILSNQSGIARGYFTREDVEKLHAHIQAEAEKYGFSFAGMYYCPHYKDGKVEKYSVDCECRKPKTGMINAAAADHGIDLNKSFMVGDKESDILAGKNAGMTTVLLGTGYGKQAAEKFKDYGYYFENISGLKTII